MGPSTTAKNILLNRVVGHLSKGMIETIFTLFCIVVDVAAFKHKKYPKP